MHGKPVQVAQVRLDTVDWHGHYFANIEPAQPKLGCIPSEELMLRDIHVVGTNDTTNEQMQDMLNAVATGIKVKTNLFHGLDEIPKLLEEVERGKISGKAVAIVD